MLFNYNSGLNEAFIRTGSYVPGQEAKTGWKLAPALNTLTTNPAIEFGQVVKRAVDGNGLPYATSIASGDTADDFYGIAYRDIVSQSQVAYGPYSTSYIYTYTAGQPVSVMRSGYICVPVQNGTPAVGGTVYMRVSASSSNANLPIGGIEATAEGATTVAIPNATFESGPFFPFNGTSTAPTASVPTSQCAIIFIGLD